MINFKQYFLQPKKFMIFFADLIIFILFFQIFDINLNAQQKFDKLNKVFKFAFIIPNSNPPIKAEENDLQSFKFSLSVAGIRVTEFNANEISTNNLQNYDIIILPFAAAKNLTVDQIDCILKLVEQGSDLVFDGDCKLAEKFDFELQNSSITVSQAIYTEFPKTALYWQNPIEVQPISVKESGNFQVQCYDKDTKAPLVISAKCGNGKFIYFSFLFDPYTDRGYSLFPYLIEMLSREFDYIPLVERKTAAMYFDPGNRSFENIDKLVQFWHNVGIKRIYAGGWYDYKKYHDYYQQLITKCHEYGILIYCWLEPPEISREFWDDHPDWREKTASLQDAQLDWRYLMNLDNDQCREQAFSEIEQLLTKFSWDGADVAELYFESTEGQKNPAHLTPMNDIVRKEFKSLYQFDPVEIFETNSIHYWKTHPENWLKFAQYRMNLCNKLKTYFLDFLSQIRKKKNNFEIIITAIDASTAPELENDISEDTKYLIDLQKKYKVTLQVEDEWMFWPGHPERYEILGKYYRKLIKKKSQLEIDFNIVPSHENGMGGLPAEKPTGEEVRQVVYNIGIYHVPPVFYAEDTIDEHDFKNINIALGHKASIIQKTNLIWEIKTPYMITVHTGKNDKVRYLDDKVWLAGDGETVIIPSGRHILKFEPNPCHFTNIASLIYISGELKQANFLNNVIEFTYFEYSSSCYAIIGMKPKLIYIDEKPVKCMIYSINNTFSIKLPLGSHKVRIET